MHERGRGAGGRAILCGPHTSRVQMMATVEVSEGGIRPEFAHGRVPVVALGWTATTV